MSKISMYRRGYLPHYAGTGLQMFVTFRLADAVPRGVVGGWQEELADKPKLARERELWFRLERYLDEGHGSCLLGNAVLAQAMVDAMQFFDGDRYDLHAWVVMPNHVHALLTMLTDARITRTVGSWKAFVSRLAHDRLGHAGRLFQPGVFDRNIRDERHFKQTVAYIHDNPRSAGLTDDIGEYRWSSASQRRTFSTTIS